MTFKHVLKNSVEKYGERPALSMVNGEPITYRQLGEKVHTLSTILADRGIKAGDRVAILSENMPNWGIAYFAITTMGAIAVPKQYNKLEEARIEGLKTLFILDNFSLIPPETTMDKLNEIIIEGQREFTKIKESAMKIAGREFAKVREDDIASFIYTSGTTGHSKAVMLTHKNFVFDALETLKIQHVSQEDRLLSVLPLSHCYEFTIGFLIPLIQGAAVYYLDKPPVAKVLLPAMQKVKPTMMLTVPLIMEKLFKTKVLPQFTSSSVTRFFYNLSFFRIKLHKIAAAKIHKMFGGELRFFGIGGALLAPEVEQFMREGNFPYAIGYGLTETSPLIAGSSPDVTKFRSTGIILPGIEVNFQASRSKLINRIRRLEKARFASEAPM